MNKERCLIILTTTACDIACEYCFYTTGHEKRDSRRFSSENAQHLAMRLLELGFTTVVITGGDPLGRRSKKETLAITKILKANDLKVVINTSGAYLTPEDCDKIVEINPDRIDFSIDSHVEGIHDRLRGRFQDVVSAIEGLIHRGYTNIVTTTVVNGLNIDTLLETLEFLKGLGVNDRRVQPAFIPIENLTVASDIKLTIDKKKSKLLSVVAQQDESPQHSDAYFNLWRKYFGQEPHMRNDVYRPVCQMGKKFFVSDAQGNITACFHRSDVKLGNILLDSVLEMEANLSQHQLATEELPSCAGAHCISLFESKACWTKEESVYGRVSNG